MEIDLNKILVDIIKLDRNIQESIKRKVEEKIVSEITDKFLEEYYSTSYKPDADQMKKHVIDELSQEKEKLIKKVLKDYTESLKYWTTDKRKKAYDEFASAVKKLEKDLPQSDY